MQEAVSMLFQSELVSEPLLLQQSHQASPKVREFNVGQTSRCESIQGRPAHSTLELNRSAA